MSDTSLAGYLLRIMLEEEFRMEREELLEECRDTKIAKLWQIFFETDMQDGKMLENRIFEFGAKIKEGDYASREIFVWMVALLHLVIK